MAAHRNIFKWHQNGRVHRTPITQRQLSINGTQEKKSRLQDERQETSQVAGIFALTILFPY